MATQPAGVAPYLDEFGRLAIGAGQIPYAAWATYGMGPQALFLDPLSDLVPSPPPPPQPPPAPAEEQEFGGRGSGGQDRRAGVEGNRAAESGSGAGFGPRQNIDIGTLGRFGLSALALSGGPLAAPALAAQAVMRGHNISNVNAIRDSLGVGPLSVGQTLGGMLGLNDYGRGVGEIARGVDIGGRSYDVSFGGGLIDGVTSLTAQEAQLRSALAPHFDNIVRDLERAGSTTGTGRIGGIDFEGMRSRGLGPGINRGYGGIGSESSSGGGGGGGSSGGGRGGGGHGPSGDNAGRGGRGNRR